LQDEAAKEIAEAFREVNDDLLERLATKEDLKEEVAQIIQRDATRPNKLRRRTSAITPCSTGNRRYRAGKGEGFPYRPAQKCDRYFARYRAFASGIHRRNGKVIFRPVGKAGNGFGRRRAGNLRPVGGGYARRRRG